MTRLTLALALLMLVLTSATSALAKLPRPYPGTPRPPKNVGVAILHVFGKWRYRQAQCVAWYENRYVWRGRGAISPTSDYGLFQVNRPSWESTFDFRQMLHLYYNTRAAYRISRGGRDWSPWSVVTIQGHCR